MSKEQPEALPVRLAKRLCDGISTGHDWPNTDDELLRMQSASELRRLAAVGQEFEALKRAISDAEPVAWRCRVGGHPWWLEATKPPPKLMMEVEPLYTLKGIK